MKKSTAQCIILTTIVLCYVMSVNAQPESEVNPDFMFFYQNGSYNNSFLKFHANGNRGTILTYNQNHNQTVWLDSNTEDAGYIGLKNDSGANILTLNSLEANTTNGFMTIYGGPSNQRLVSVFASPQHTGTVLTEGPNSINSYAGHVNGNTDLGYVGVADSTNNYQAGIYVDTNNMGVVFGDIKNFVLPHPERQDESIVYASLEGPEAAAYMRGTSRLINGKAIINFPEHFRIVGNPSTMTIQLTPLSAQTYGLAVVSKNEDGFQVAELMQGHGNFEFDWEVKTVRRNFEDFKVVRKKRHNQPPREIPQIRQAKEMPIPRNRTIKK